MLKCRTLPHFRASAPFPLQLVGKSGLLRVVEDGRLLTCLRPSFELESSLRFSLFLCEPPALLALSSACRVALLALIGQCPNSESEARIVVLSLLEGEFVRVPAEKRYEVDSRFISANEAIEYLVGLTPRDRKNFRRTQAWFDHCARIRSHLSSNTNGFSAHISAEASLENDTEFYRLDMF